MLFSGAADSSAGRWPAAGQKTGPGKTCGVLSQGKEFWFLQQQDDVYPIKPTVNPGSGSIFVITMKTLTSNLVGLCQVVCDIHSVKAS